MTPPRSEINGGRLADLPALAPADRGSFPPVTMRIIFASITPRAHKCKWRTLIKPFRLLSVRESIDLISNLMGIVITWTRASPLPFAGDSYRAVNAESTRRFLFVAARIAGTSSCSISSAGCVSRIFAFPREIDFTYRTRSESHFISSLWFLFLSRPSKCLLFRTYR